MQIPLQIRDSLVLSIVHDANAKLLSLKTDNGSLDAEPQMALQSLSWKLSFVSCCLVRDNETHEKIRLERYDTNEEKDEYFQYESEN